MPYVCLMSDTKLWRKCLFWSPLILLVLVAGCDTDSGGDPINPTPGSLFESSVILNRIERAPLSVRLTFSTLESAEIRVTVKGTNGPDSDVSHLFAGNKREHDLIVHGLTANTMNDIVVNATAGNVSEDVMLAVTTDPHPAWMPKIEINTITPGAMKGNMTLVSYRGRVNPNAPFIFDQFGEVRWYLDFMNDPELSGLYYDVGMERLVNGNWYFGSAHTNQIYEIDMTGRIQNQWDMPGHQFHHTVVEKPNGNFLVTTSKFGSMHESGRTTVEDHIIELSRTTGEIVAEWDLKESLNENRETLISFSNNYVVDWVHCNSVLYDERDTSIIVSGRTQGVVKLNYENEVQWILGPHKEWGTNKSGDNLDQYLLTPLDGNNEPISSESILEGSANHSDFEWNWYQHALLLTEEGTLMLFDNGANRNWGAGQRYSRAVEYVLDEDAMTVGQRWQYGKSNGEETFSSIVSDVDVIGDSDHILFSPGAIAGAPNNESLGRVQEVVKSTGQVVFDASILGPINSFISFHRAERVSLYP